MPFRNPASSLRGRDEGKATLFSIKHVINNDGRFELQDKPEYKPEVSSEPEDSEKLPEDEYLTETLAGIYIKQGRYLKALEIIKRLNLNIPKENAYFADQIRFLEKLIVNSGQKR